MNRFLALFDFEGSIGPREYLGTGVAAMAAKYLIDRQVAAWIAHRPWEPWSYLNPFRTAVQMLSMGAADRNFLFVMSIVAVPFVWLGLSLTVKRLRSMHSPLSCVVLFFIPIVNLVMFAMLSTLKPSPKPEEKSESGIIGGAAFAVWTSLAVCTATVALAVHYLEYGWALFVGSPFCLGLMSSVLYAWKKPRTQKECTKVAMLTCGAAAVALLAFAFEGVICLLMATPLTLPMAALGAIVGFYVQPHRLTSVPSIAMLMLIAVFPPAMVKTESKLAHDRNEFTVTSTVEVNAPPEVVWNNVVTFSRLEEPTELMFKSGIAYPMRAEIEGRGVGAVRYCVFSTGPFVEPITVWDEPRMLEFTVTQVPSPMQEMSPYPELHPPHLDGFFVSRKGHFVLTPLPGNRTKLEGTTWYRHNLWPEAYWQLWSDYIVHRIHMRVLEHVRKLSEEDMHK